MYIRNINKKSINLRCRFYDKSKANQNCCKFTSALQLEFSNWPKNPKKKISKSIFSPFWKLFDQLVHIFDKNNPNFYRIENFRIKSISKLAHSCVGYDSENEAKRQKSQSEYENLIELEFLNQNSTFFKSEICEIENWISLKNISMNCHYRANFRNKWSPNKNWFQKIWF